MNRVDHQDFFDIDLPKLKDEFREENQFVEFLNCLDKAVREIMKDPANEGAPLTHPPLAPTYRKKKFHSIVHPRQGMKADMRLVYRCDLAANTVYVFGVGKRRTYQIDDIYKMLSTRTPI